MIKNIFQSALPNGLQLKYIRNSNTSLVDIQVWFLIGSAYEKENELGICHMIEHMIFKGSKNIGLGELDNIIYQLNGSTNAFTTKEFTAYTFSVPKHYFTDAMKIISMLFDQPRFDKDDLETEKKVVIQEILDYQDDPFSVLIDNAFLYAKSKYNYQYPILGTIETVSSFTSEQLQAFYLKHYRPNKTVFFITGDIPKNNIIKEFQSSYFAKLSQYSENNHLEIAKKNEFFKKNNIQYSYSHSLNNYFLVTYVVKSPSYYFFNIYKAIDILLGAEKDSLLYKKLCLEMKLVSSIKTLFYTFSKETFFSFYFIPIKLDQVPKIIQTIYDTVNFLKETFLDEPTLEKIYNILYFDFCMLKTEQSEDFIFEKIPYILKENRNYLKFPFKKDLHILKKQIQSIIKNLVNKNVTINAVVNHQYNPFFNSGQEKKITSKNKNSITSKYINHEYNSDGREIINNINKNNLTKSFQIIKKAFYSIRKKNQKDTKIKFQIRKKKFPPFAPTPIHTTHILDNQMIAIFINHYDQNDELICITLNLNIKHYYEDSQFQGGLGFLFDLMYYGTKSHPQSSFIDYIEKYGIYFNFTIGTIEIHALKRYWKEAITALVEYITEPELSPYFFDIVKDQIIESIHNFNDDQILVGTQYNKKIMYPEHPFSQNPSGTINTISNISYEYLLDLYAKFIFPENAILICNGPFNETEKQVIMNELLKFKKKEIKQYNVQKVEKKLDIKKYYYKHIEKEQILISILGYSTIQYTKDYYCLLLAEQILCGTLTNSMYSLLFGLRELFGYYYYINGTLTYNCTKEPGLIMLQAITRKEYYQESILLIKKVLLELPQLINEYDVYMAQQALLFTITKKNELRSVQNAYLNNIYRNNFTQDNLLERYNMITKINKNEIVQVLTEYLQEKNIFISIIKKIDNEIV